MKPLGALFAALVAFGSAGCPSTQPARAARASSPAASAPAASAPAASADVPVPETLSFEAGQFGLTVLAEGWRWKAIRKNLTRFDWSGRPPSGDREILYSFWDQTVDAKTNAILPQIVSAATANLSEGEPCRPFDQPQDIVSAAFVDRIVTVCFEPSTFYATEFKHGVLHGVVKGGKLTLVVVLSNDRSGLVPLPAAIGARGRT